jgi:hypothetical protein
MIERTAPPNASFVARALAAFAQLQAESGLLFRYGKKAQQAIEAFLGYVR